MTNAKKYLKDGAGEKEFIEKFVSFALINGVDIPYWVFRDFFNQQAQPILTEDERVILRNARTWGNEKFRYIMRTDYGLRVTANAFHCSENEPEEEGFDLYAFDHLFQFIKERRRIRNS